MFQTPSTSTITSGISTPKDDAIVRNDDNTYKVMISYR